MNTTEHKLTGEERLPLSVEELLLPRRKFIADYPGNYHFKVGDVIAFNEIDDRDHLQPERYVKQPSIHNNENYKEFRSYFLYQIDRYPHLFQPLPWWAEREEWQLPAFVKYKDGEVMPMSLLAHKQQGIFKYKDYFLDLDNCSPATLADYESYLSQQSNQ